MKYDYEQFIADLYHCSDAWGQKTTAEEMRINLEEWRKDAEPGEYVPENGLAEKCAIYWNSLCDMYPS